MKSGAVSDEKRRVLLVLRLAIVIVTIGAGLSIWLPGWRIRTVPLGLYVGIIGLLVLIGAGYVGIVREFD